MKYLALLTAAGLASAAFLAVAAPEGREGRAAAMAERFKQADTNGDGFIDQNEAKALPMISKHFQAIDANGDGKVSADELRAFHEKLRAEHGKHRGDFLKKLDTDGDGRISKAEAQAAPRLAEHFGEIDANGDGFITPDEMKAAHQRRAK